MMQVFSFSCTCVHRLIQPLKQSTQHFPRANISFDQVLSEDRTVNRLVRAPDYVLTLA